MHKPANKPAPAKGQMDLASIRAIRILGFISRERELIEPDSSDLPDIAKKMGLSPDELRALILMLMASPTEWERMDVKVQNTVPLKALKYYNQNNPALDTFQLSRYLECPNKEVEDLFKSL